MTVPQWAGDAIAELRWPAIFATVGGEHLYGFASAASHLELRAVHLLPVRELVGVETGTPTLEVTGRRDGVEFGVVSYELSKFGRMLIKPNGYVLEHLLSPLVVTSTAVHRELVDLIPGLVTVDHAGHYQLLALRQRRRFEKTGERKPALVMLRLALTGAHLMRTGQMLADLHQLSEGHDLPYVAELIAAKVAGDVQLDERIVSRVRLHAGVHRLHVESHLARARSPLPKRASQVEALNDLIVRVHLEGG